MSSKRPLWISQAMTFVLLFI